MFSEVTVIITYLKTMGCDNKAVLQFRIGRGRKEQTTEWSDISFIDFEYILPPELACGSTDTTR